MESGSAETVSGRAPAPKTYEYIPPRLDPDQFQAAVPEWDGNVLTDERRIPPKADHAPATYSAEFAPDDTVQKYLAFSRLLMRGAEAEKDPHQPLESDAAALEYLASFGYDMQQANFHLFSNMGVGKELHLMQLATGYIDKNPVNALFSEYRERFTRNQARPFLGAYSSAAASSGDSFAPSGRSPEEEGKEEATGRGSRAVNNEKTEARRKWFALLEQTNATLAQSRHAKDRMDLVRAQALLDEAMTITVPFNVALSGGGSAAQAAEDFANMERLRANLGEVVKRVILSREWGAEVLDLFYRKFINVVIHDSTSRRNVASLASLNEILKRGENLDFPCSLEEQQLRLNIASLQTVQNRIKAFMSTLRVSPLRGYEHVFAENTTESLRRGIPHVNPYTVRMLEDRLCTALNLTLETSPGEDVMVLLSPLDHFLEDGPSSFSLEDKEVSFPASVRQASYDDLATIVMGEPGEKRDCLARFSEHAYFQTLWEMCSMFRSRLRDLLHAFSILQRKEKINESQDKKHVYDVQKVRRLALAACRFPISLPETDELRERMDRVTAWQNEVKALCNETSSSASAQSMRRSRRSHGGQGSSQSGAVPMKKVEALLQEGLRFPFGLTTEMNILREKKESAKVWLEKLKKTFGLGTSRGRSAARSKPGVEEGDKLSFSEMRMLVEAGAAMYTTSDDAEQRVGPRGVLRDLDKATGIIENAGEWVQRVQAAVQAQCSHGYRGLGLAPPPPSVPSRSPSPSPSPSPIQPQPIHPITVQTSHVADEGFQEILDSFTRPSPDASEEASCESRRLPAAVERAIKMDMSHGVTMDMGLGMGLEMGMGLGLGLDLPSEAKAKSPLEEQQPPHEQEESPKVDVEDENELQQEREALTDSLTALLEEADAMPIVLEETDILRIQLQALFWAMEARPVLLQCVVSPPPAGTTDSLTSVSLQHSLSLDAEEEGGEGEMEVEGDEEGRAAAKKASSSSRGVPLQHKLVEQNVTYAELQDMQAKISKIREKVDDLDGIEMAQQPLPEEVFLSQLLANAEGILQIVRKALNSLGLSSGGSSSRKSSGGGGGGGSGAHSLASLCALVQTARSQPVDVDREIKPLVTCVTSALRWLVTHRNLLVHLDLLDPEDWALCISAGLVPPSSADAVHEEKKEEDLSMVSLEEWEGLMKGLPPMDCGTVRRVKAKASEITHWVSRVKQLSKQFSHVLSSPSAAGNGVAPPGVPITATTLLTNSMSGGGGGGGGTAGRGKRSNARGTTPNATGPVSGEKEEPTAAGGEGAAEESSGATAGAAASSSAASQPASLAAVAADAAANAFSRNFVFRPSLQMDDLRDLLEESTTLGVQLSEHCAALQLLVAQLESWERDTWPHVSTILGHAADDVYQVLAACLHYPPRAICLPFLEGFGAGDGASGTGETPGIPMVPFPISGEAPLIALTAKCLEGVGLDVYLPATSVALTYRSLLLVERATRWLLVGSADSTTGVPKGMAWGDLTTDVVSGMSNYLQRLRQAAATTVEEMSSSASSSVVKTETPDPQRLLAPYETFLQGAHDPDLQPLGMVAESSESNLEASGVADISPGEGMGGENGEGMAEMNEAGGAMDVADESTSAPAHTTSSQRTSKRRREEVSAASPTPTSSGGGVASTKKRRGATLAIPAADEDSTAAGSANSTGSLVTGMETWDAFCSLWSLPSATNLLQSLKTLPKGQAETVDGPSVHPLVPWIRLVDLYLVCLDVLGRRIEEAQTLRHHLHRARQLHQSASLQHYLQLAALRGIRCGERTWLESILLAQQQWLVTARAMMQGETAAYCTIEGLRDFVKAGEALGGGVTTELQRLKGEIKAELKKARAWKAAYDSLPLHAVGSGQADTSLTARTEELLQQAQTLHVNLAEFTDTMTAFSKKYCLCRQANYGQMIGCDTCEEWYHFSCVMLSGTQAEKCVQYVCVLCALKNSMSRAANAAAMISNKWNDKMGVLRNRDQQIEKLTKKIDKLERERALMQPLSAKVPAQPTPAPAGPPPAAASTSAPATEEPAGEDQAIKVEPSLVPEPSPPVPEPSPSEAAPAETSPAPAPAPAAATTSLASASEVPATTPASTTPVPASAVPAVSAVHDKLTALHYEIDALKAQLVQTRKDRFREALKYKDIVNFMYALQRLLWCSNGATSSSSAGGAGAAREAHASGGGETTSEDSRAALKRLGKPFDPFDSDFYPFPLAPGPLASSLLAPAGPTASANPSLPTATGEINASSGDSANSAGLLPAALDPTRGGSSLFASRHASTPSAAVAAASASASASSSSAQPPASETSPSSAPSAAAGSAPPALPLLGWAGPPSYPVAMRSLSHYLHCLLPLGGWELQHYAHAHGLAEIEDVVVLLDALRWIGWCNATLHVLRYPAPTPLLRALLDATKSLRFSDDKAIKFLANILSRACAWKAKVRKYALQNKRLDEAKLSALHIEGASLPFTSRLKTTLKQLMEKYIPDGVPTTNDGAGGGGEGGAGGKGRGSKGSKPAPNPGSTSAPGKIVLGDLPVSSDEEDNYQREAVLSDPRAGPSARVSNAWARRMSYPEDNEVSASLAPPHTVAWPPAITLRMAHSGGHGI